MAFVDKKNEDKKFSGTQCNPKESLFLCLIEGYFSHCAALNGLGVVQAQDPITHIMFNKKGGWLGCLQAKKSFVEYRGHASPIIEIGGGEAI